MCCDPSPVLYSSEHDLDTAAAFVFPPVVSDRFSTTFPARNAGLYPFPLQGIPKPICVIPAIGQHPLGYGKTVGKGCCTCIITGLPRRHEEAQRSSVLIGDGMQLRIHTAFCATDQATWIPFLSRRLGAVRCALR